MPEPHVVIVMPAQWPRSLIRAALIEAGYDAAGAEDLRDAMRYLAAVPNRATVGVLLVDDDALRIETDRETQRLLGKFAESRTILLARATHPEPPGAWTLVLRRPVSVETIVDAVRELAPHDTGAASSADD